MALLKRGMRGWQLLTLAVIAVPWFLRDQLAASLESQTHATQAILHALDNERQRQHLEREQRDTLGRLERIEILVSQIANKTTGDERDEEEKQAFDLSVRAEGASLATAVDVLEGLLKEASLSASADKSARDAAQSARAAAQQLEQQYGKGDEAQDDTLLKTFDQASDQLEKAFETLYAEAEVKSAATARWADIFRFVAWVLTGLGALMIGDATRLFGRADDETKTPSGRA